MKTVELLVLAAKVLFCIYLSLHDSRCREFKVSFLPTASVAPGFLHREELRTKSECVITCVRRQQCRSLIVNKTSQVCYQYSSALPSTEKGPELLYGYLNKRLLDRCDGNKTTMYLIKGKLTRPMAKIACKNRSGHILNIDNDIKQAQAVKLAEESGLELVAIGVFKYITIGWFQENRNIPITYEAWADGEPRNGINAALSKAFGYKWESVGRIVDGVLCEKEFKC